MSGFHLCAMTPLEPGRAHDGVGVVHAARLVERCDTALRFVDRAVIDPGASIGLHRHGADEEIYVVVTGTGTMTVDGETRTVAPGDVVINPPHGVHGLVNTGDQPLMIVVVDVVSPPVPQSGAGSAKT
jgi:quercetin dioxygenase-like cupin family protein